MYTRTMLALLGLVALPLALHAQTVDLRPGSYEVTGEMEMPGMPMKLPPQKLMTCITAEDLKDLSGALRDQKEMKGCKVSNYKVSGRTVTFDEACETDGRKTTGTTEITAAGDSFTKVTKAKTGDGRVITFKSNGKRVGECMKDLRFQR